ncbi:MAG: PH domain-containing protein [Planctomycetes bacterium]|nr:PH domain-containing protein [Planctomycetota bacterium]
MQCPRCQAEVEPKAKFCPSCGAALAEGAAPTAGPAAGLGPRPGESVEEESDLWEGAYSPKAMVGTWVLLAVVSIAVIAGAIFLGTVEAAAGIALLWPIAIGLIVVMWVIGIGLALYRKWSVHYKVTTQRLIHRRGLLSVRTDRIELIDVDDITFQQGLVERMFGVGTVNISSSDRSHPELLLRGIDEVHRISDLIDDARRKERRRRGLHIEAI